MAFAASGAAAAPGVAAVMPLVPPVAWAIAAMIAGVLAVGRRD
jgi:hypothetical protein